jgi:hypothetical protein
MIPTRWRARLGDQLADAQERVGHAEEHLGREEGNRALQAAYQAVVAAATLDVWIGAEVWAAPLAPESMPARVQEAFPNLFAALAALDLPQALTSAWTTAAAQPYVVEARAYVDAAARKLEACLRAG